MTFTIYTLGCKVNTYESEAMRGLLENDGRLQYTAENPDIFILNSCMVTEESEKKALKILRRAKRENPNVITCVTGCMSQMVPEKLGGADIVIGNTSRKEILPKIEEFLKNREKITSVCPHEKGEKFEILAPSGYEHLTRANLKIEDGCDCYCSYCIIPYARGHVRSMPPEEIFGEAKILTASGHREIVLTGINIGMYGRDNDYTLFDAVSETARACAERIRLGSLEIDLLTKDIIGKLANIPGFCPHFHTSLQSGSDTVLKRMNRHYTKDEYYELVCEIRRCFDNPSITTDVIVGFAGETDEEFQETVDFVKKVGFYKIHVFPYSKRSGTIGAKMPDQVPENVKKQRAATLGKISDELYKKFINSQIGKVHSVLFETEENGEYYGHTENYIYVKVKASENLKNKIKNTEIIGISDGMAIGKVIE